MSKNTEIYVSVDIESDGSIPGVNSMLSLGAAAFQLPSRTPILTFEVNILPLPTATPDPDTMKWWATQEEAWKYVTQNQRDPAEAMHEFAKWTKALPGKPVMVCYPVWDFMWAYWYLWRFTGTRPYGLGALDIKTLAMTQMGRPYRDCVKRNMPKRWFEGCPKHTHKALDDALGQGIQFVNIMNEMQG